MSLPEILIVYVGGGLLTLAAAIALIRALRGPTVLDRVVASDVLLTTLILVMGIEMIVNRHTHTVPVMIGVAATAALATVTVARFVRRGLKNPVKQADNAPSYTQMIDVSGAQQQDAAEREASAADVAADADKRWQEQ